MFDRKTIRRRRAALVAFVAASMVLITVSFSGGGPLGAIQRGAQEIVSPIESGANRALKPVRDLFGWLGDTFDAKDDNEQLREEVADLREELGAREAPSSTGPSTEPTPSETECRGPSSPSLK